MKQRTAIALCFAFATGSGGAACETPGHVETGGASSTSTSATGTTTSTGTATGTTTSTSGTTTSTGGNDFCVLDQSNFDQCILQ
jgi:hypothetical protein